MNKSLETKLCDGNPFIKYTGYILFRKIRVKEMAEVQKEEIGFPILGQKAPEFEAVTTQGMLRLSDFKGTWLVLFSHPADFTPVCTTAFT